MARTFLLAAITFIGVLITTSAGATCFTFHTLMNTTTADANPVMDNFNYILTCPNFTGNVGIGTANATQKLSVETTSSGNQSLATLNVPNVVGNNGSIDFAVDSGGTIFPVSRITAQYGASGHIGLSFSTFNGSLAEAMRIAYDGSVGIGRTSPGQKLDVAGTIRQSGCVIVGSLSVNSSGDIVCTSDARLKNVLGGYTSGLEAILRITPQHFTYKTTSTDPVETFVHAGFIAQNVMTAIPEATAKQPNGYYSLDTTAILAASVNAIKQLKAANDRQAMETNRLRAEISQIERVSVQEADEIGRLKRQQTAEMRELKTQISALQRKGSIRTATN